MGAALSLMSFIAVPFAGGVLGSVTTMFGLSEPGILVAEIHPSCAFVRSGEGLRYRKEVKGWYTTLKKPRWNPPNWLFGPAWTLLYTCMGTASWLVWRQGGFAAQALPLGVYAAQLVLNMAWSPLFFGAHELGLAMVDISGMWAGILSSIVLFHKVSPTAAYLMVPYLGWVSFAGALNLNIWRNNGDNKGKLTGKTSGD